MTAFIVLKTMTVRGVAAFSIRISMEVAAKKTIAISRLRDTSWSVLAIVILGWLSTAFPT